MIDPVFIAINTNFHTNLGRSVLIIIHNVFNVLFSYNDTDIHIHTNIMAVFHAFQAKFLTI